MSPVQVNKKTISDVLLVKNIIDQPVYDKIKLENINTNKPIEQIVVDHNFASGEEIAKAKAEVYKVPYTDLKETSVSPEALNLLPEPVARRYICFPYGLSGEGQKLLLAMKNPMDLTAIEFIEQKTGKRIAPAIALEKNIIAAIEQYYSQSLSSKVTQA
ncbi:unnamed protein product, partial [marine sediment metagenome]